MIVLVAQQVLAAQEHLQLGVGHVRPDLPQPLPGILIQIAQAGVEGGAAPALHGIVARLVHGFEDIFKIRIGQPGRHQRLVRITKDGFCDSDFVSHRFPSVERIYCGAVPGKTETGPISTVRIITQAPADFHPFFQFIFGFTVAFSRRFVYTTDTVHYCNGKGYYNGESGSEQIRDHRGEGNHPQPFLRIPV